MAFNRALCSAINRSMRATSDGGKTCLTRSMSSKEVMVLDFLVTDPKDLKQQSMWYQRVLGEWPYRTDGGLLPRRYSPLISGWRQSLYVHLDLPSLVISATYLLSPT